MGAELTPNNAAVLLSVTGLVCWIVALAGTAATSAKCTEFENNLYKAWVAPEALKCSKQLQGPWWAVCFNFIMFVAVIGLAVLSKLAQHRFTLLAIYAACVSLTMQAANAFIIQGATAFMATLDKEVESQMRAAAAGFVLISIVDFLMMVLLGSFMEGLQLQGAAGHVADMPAPVIAAPIAPLKHGSGGLAPNQVDSPYSQPGRLSYQYSDPQSASQATFPAPRLSNAGSSTSSLPAPPPPHAAYPAMGGNVYLA